MQEDALRRESGGDGEFELAGGADVESEPFLGDPVGHGAREEGLGGIEDFGLGEGIAVGAAAGSYLALVQDVGRGVEAVGDLAQRDPADGEAAVREPGRRGRPDGQLVGARGDLGQCGSGHGTLPPQTART